MHFFSAILHYLSLELLLKIWVFKKKERERWQLPQLRVIYQTKGGDSTLLNSEQIPSVMHSCMDYFGRKMCCNKREWKVAI